MRRQLNLPQDDTSFLEAHRFEWETIIERGNWLIIHSYPVPQGYTLNKVDIAIQISAGYPDTQLDMVYVYPALALQNGRGINALSGHALDGKTWQRWSRHRTSANPWRPGIDDLSGHLTQINHWFMQEIRKAG